MIVKLVNPDGTNSEVAVDDPIYRHLMIGITRYRGLEGFIVAVCGIAGVTDGTDGWYMYIDRYLLVARPLVSRLLPPGDGPCVPPFIGASDPLAFQLSIRHDGVVYQIGNGDNLAGDAPIERVDPETVTSITFDMMRRMVDVTLA
jgi:hypothetical protein